MGSKRYEQAVKLVDLKKAYPLAEAVALLKELPHTTFDECVELSASLNMDSKKTDQLVRGTLTLPHGTGRARRVLVFCRGEKELQAKEAKADYVGGAELIDKIQNGWMEFDVVVATPDMMREVSRLGKLLGPRGLMPSPKAGTITDDVAGAIRAIQGGKVEFKMDKLANLHLVIGKLSFQVQQLVENAQAAIEAVLRARPASLKGQLFRRLSLASTMSPGIALNTEGLEQASE